MAVALSPNSISTAAPPQKAEADNAFVTRDLSVWYGAKEAVKKVSLNVLSRHITAIIGPSGCGKSTFLRCLNRMHEVVSGATTKGKVLLDQQDIYARDVDPVRVRGRVGMVFQKPNPLPTMSIRDNVLAGLRLNGVKLKDPDGQVEKALRAVALWDEVKDRLAKAGTSLSGGQQH